MCAQVNRTKKSNIVGLTVLLIGVVVVGYLALWDNTPPVPDPITPQSQPAASGTPYTPQPPGEAPPGKVWSAEHGHWHDAPGTTPTTTPNRQPGATSIQYTPQPPGPVPEGKVWSPEHGHWHDAPQSTAADSGSGTGP
jgi:hypothetical protein